MKKTKYVIGHKNPDTDAIVSSIAYANFKEKLEGGEYIPVRAGKLNPQTEYILDRFNVEPPMFLNDLTPRVQNYMKDDITTINRNEPLWDALSKLNENKARLLPIVDDENKYHSVLHYNVFAQSLINKMAPNKSKIIPTSISHLVKTLKAQPVVTFDEDDIIKAHISIAGMKFESFKKSIDAKIPEKVVCIVGDRDNVQEYVIDNKIKALIITGGKMISKKLKKKAEKNGVSVLISPFETAKTSWLAIYSTPVKYMGDTEVSPLKKDAYISSVISSLEDSISRCLPVVDEDYMVKGIISESDLVSDPNIEIIMVDHNEQSQAIDGLENYKILEIIDHHRLGNLHTDYPIRFINKPVGSTSTLIAQMYREHKIPLKKDIASLLLAGILSDTVILQSTTTTEEDKEVSEYLSGITDLSIEEFGKDITRISSQVLEKPTSEILNMDMKVYDAPNYKYSVSQIEVVNPDRVMDEKNKFFQELEKKKKQNGYLFSALMVTDIVNLNSLLLIKGEPEYIMRINYPKKEKNVYVLNGIISRKKQLIPYLMELVKKYG